MPAANDSTATRTRDIVRLSIHNAGCNDEASKVAIVSVYVFNTDWLRADYTGQGDICI